MSISRVGTELNLEKINTIIIHIHSFLVISIIPSVQSTEINTPIRSVNKSMISIHSVSSTTYSPNLRSENYYDESRRFR